MFFCCFFYQIPPKPPLFFRSAFFRGDETAVFLLFNIFFGILHSHTAYLLGDHTAIYLGSIGAFYKPKHKLNMEQFIHEIQNLAAVASNVLEANEGLALLSASKEKCNLYYF